MAMIGKSLYKLLKKELLSDDKQYIEVHCPQLDELLGVPGFSGIQRGIVTELNGLSGSGKTQLW